MKDDDKELVEIAISGQEITVIGLKMTHKSNGESKAEINVQTYWKRGSEGEAREFIEKAQDHFGKYKPKMDYM